MKLSEYKNYDDLPLFLNAAMVAKVLGVSPSSSYELMHVVGVSSASLASGQGRKLVRSAAPPLPTKPKDGFAGTPFANNIISHIILSCQYGKKHFHKFLKDAAGGLREKRSPEGER